MGFLNDFKTYAVKGNLADLAIGVVIGGAFGKVVSSFIEGCVMPIVGLLTGGIDFNQQMVVIKKGVAGIKEVKDAAGNITTAAVAEIPEVAIKYGSFIGSIITFLIVALVCFIIIKNLLKKDPNAAPDTPPQEVLLGEIRDLLKK
jgi:large conductance mechanosensitive channel